MVSCVVELPDILLNVVGETKGAAAASAANYSHLSRHAASLVLAFVRMKRSNELCNPLDIRL